VSQSDGYFKCVCQNCGGHIEFPGEGAGRTVPCPHCNGSTVLTVDAYGATAPVGGSTGAWKKIFLALLIAATVVAADMAIVYWNHVKNNPSPAPPPSAAGQPGLTSKPAAPVPIVLVAPPDPWHGLMAGPITLEQAGDGRLVYAVGKLRNASDHQRFGVKVELDVFNAAHDKVGTATDYTPSIDPDKEWRFRALVTDRDAATAQLTAVKED
jgi:hypothetical protein